MDDIVVLASKILFLIGLMSGFLMKDIYLMVLSGFLLLNAGSGK